MTPAEQAIAFYWRLMHCGLPLTATVAQGRDKAQFSGQKLHLLGDIRRQTVFLFVCLCVLFFNTNSVNSALENHFSWIKAYLVSHFTNDFGRLHVYWL